MDVDALMRLVDEHAQAYYAHRALMMSSGYMGLVRRIEESRERLHKAANAIREYASGVREDGK
jgi:hypothetical protein